MQRIVRSVSLAVVAIGLMFVAAAPSRADDCCAARAGCCTTFRHCHHYGRYHHGCYVATVAPNCGCTTFVPAAATRTVVPCTNALPRPHCSLRLPRSVLADLRAAISVNKNVDQVAPSTSMRCNVTDIGCDARGNPRFRGLPCGHLAYIGDTIAPRTTALSHGFRGKISERSGRPILLLRGDDQSLGSRRVSRRVPASGVQLGVAAGPRSPGAVRHCRPGIAVRRSWATARANPHRRVARSSRAQRRVSRVPKVLGVSGRHQ